MFGVRDRRLSLLVGLLFLPFALQLLGWADTPLGGGPCGPIASERLLLEQPQAFFYAQVMLWGISLLLADGFFILMLAFMHNGMVPPAQARPFVLLALVVSLFTASIYLLDRTLGLPVPSPVGWLLGGAEPVDVVGVLIVLVLLGQVVLSFGWLRTSAGRSVA
ncbi:MAG: hypothetical protein NZ849_11065 [Meiothermus sp.]|uniref:hypothetical protein n=1 Tax=Meiothermus sp. TaxID=1955249 RepID=UPI0025E1F932|nr:hypothetical protein [Meiothermus sp.]MCS7058526.1 hypothetical protein [Meiothermus sp.]MCS7195430.1 hypothetical protein [Meiothermus sp.]MDW8091057.1 hypothetical protein [Meiothermus sp.]MDW8480946.1 hypothetical protein [Meiothermus sp.]